MKDNFGRKFFIIIVVLAVILMVIVFLRQAKNKAEENIIDLNHVENQQQEEVSENTEEEIYLYSQEIKEIVNKFNFEISTQGSIYKVGNFDSGNVPNDLILRMGWNGLKLMKFSNGEDIVELENVSQEEMQKSIQNLLGDSIQYQDETFENIAVKTFEGYNENHDTIVYEDGEYKTEYVEGGGGSVPYIYEVAQKAVKSGNQIKIYVKTAFVDTVYNEETNDFKNRIYSDFDFENEEFKNEVKILEEVDFYKDTYEYIINQGGICLVDNPQFNEIDSEFDTYSYTFEKDFETEEYYLVAFENVDNEEKEIFMSEQIVKKAKIEQVIGKYLAMYAERDCIQKLLYEVLNLYESLDLVEEPIETDEIVVVDGEEYNLYQTKISFEDYKNALLNYVSEEIFEEQFMTYQKEIDGKLYIVYNAGDGKNYEIVDMLEMSNNIYTVNYKFYQGENEGIEGDATVTLEKKEDSYVVKNCKID